MKGSVWAWSSPRYCLVLIPALLLISVALAGCGSGSGNGFRLGSGSNNAILKGQYAFA